MVKSNRPIGIAVMALSAKYLQCMPRWMAKYATAAASDGDEEGGISRTQGSVVAHTVGIATKCRHKSIRARREGRQCMWGTKGDAVVKGPVANSGVTRGRDSRMHCRECGGREAK